MATNNQITTATNLTGPAVNNPTGNANKYFTNLYTVDMSVGPETNDALIAFFESYTGNKQAGQNLAGAILYSSKAQGVNPMAILDQLQKLPKGQLNSYLLAFLNSSRVPTSSLGVRTSTKTSPYITRTLLV